MTIYKEHTRISLVEGGNVFKQGENVTLGFVARDYAGNVIDLTGKDIAGVIYGGRKGIMYEAPATFDAEGQKIVFTIDEMLEHGISFIEFTATDPNDPEYRMKFPSKESGGEITIKPSSDNMDYVGVQMTTVTQLQTELQTMQTDFEGEVLPRVQTVEVRQNEVEATVEAGIAAFTEDTEVLLARGGEVNLGARLDKTTAQLAEKASQSDLSTTNANLSTITTKVNDPLRRRTHLSFLNPLATEGVEGDVWIKVNPFYNFEGDTIGALPSGWSYQFGNGFSVNTVDGTKAIRSGSRGAITRSALRSNDVGIVADSDVKVDIFVQTKDTLTSLAARIGGASGTENCYVARLQANASTPLLDIFKYVNGTGTQLASLTGITVNANTWYTLRFKVTGNTLQAKWWTKGQAEPASWSVTTTDASLTTGYVGIFEAFTGVAFFDNWELL